MTQNTSAQAGSNPPADNSGAGQNPPESQGTQNTGDQSSHEAHIASLNKESAKYRKERDDALAKLKEHQDSQMTETERMKAELDEVKTTNAKLTSDYTTLRIAQQFTEAARSAGARYPDVLHKFATPSELTLNDKGEIENLNGTLTRLKQAYPELFGPGGTADGRAGNGQPAAGGMNSMIRQAAGH